MRFGDRNVGVFVVANFVADEQEEIVQSVQVVGADSAGVLLIASVLAWLAAGRVLAPVRLVTATARSITDTDFSRRIPVRGGDEIVELTTTFNDMLDRLERAFTIQRDFVSDAGHELRTPITIRAGHRDRHLQGPRRAGRAGQRAGVRVDVHHRDPGQPSWGAPVDPGSNVVDVYIRYLRQKLGNDVIETARGMGYRLRG